MLPPDVDRRARKLLQEELTRVYRRTDKAFALLLFAQWIVGIFISCIISPVAWLGVMSSTHPHVYAGFFLGGLICLFPIGLALKCPGHVMTRHVIAVAQMLWSALLIHLCGGRMETHFHIFASLAFLSLYRDWRVLATAGCTIALDHLVRGCLWTRSVYGIDFVQPWRWLEHIGWVIFEIVVLITASRQIIAQLFDNSLQRAKLERADILIEREVTRQTEQISRLAAIVESSEDAIVGEDFTGTIISWNKAAENLYQFKVDDIIGLPIRQIIPPELESDELQIISSIRDGHKVEHFETERVRRDGVRVQVSLSYSPIRDQSGEIIGVSKSARDISKQKALERKLR